MRRRAVLFAAMAMLVLLTTHAQLSGQTALALYKKAEAFLADGDFYRASDSLETALAINPAFAEAWSLLSRCQYELGEYERALGFIEEAFRYGPRNPATLNLKGFILLGLGRLEEARKTFQETVSGLPKDRDARFGLAMLDLGSGKPGEAKSRLSESLAVYPSDSRALLSLAAIARAENKNEEAAALLKEALRWLSDNAESSYAAAELYAEQGNMAEAARLAQNALALRPGHSGALKLLALLSYMEGSLEDARHFLNTSLKNNRKDTEAWFLLGLAEQAAMHRPEAEYAFRSILDLDPGDEIARIALENYIMDTTPFEDTARADLADWHFSRALDFERSFLNQKAVTEYRRGLAINPYAGKGRKRYADLLLSAGLSNSYLAELRFLDSIGKTDSVLKDAIEVYDSFLAGSVGRDWAMFGESQENSGAYSLGMFSLAHGAYLYHPGSDAVFARYLRDMLVFEPMVKLSRQVPAVSRLSDAYQLARDAGLDYYAIVSLAETDRTVLASLELRSAKTAALVKRIEVPRAGNDRIALAAFQLIAEIKNQLEPKGSLVSRKGNLGLVSLGKAAGIKKGDSFFVIKKGAVSISPDGKALSWKDDDIVAAITADRVDDDFFEGRLERMGFFDRINPGDVVVMQSRGKTAKKQEADLSAGINWSALYERLRKLY